ADPFTDRWPGYDPAHIGYVFSLRIVPGQTLALMTFVAKGLSETGANAPAAGSEIARVTDIARKLVAAPDLRGLTARQRSQIVNWNLPGGAPAPSFSVFEKSVEQLQEAQEATTRGPLTSEDLVRDYLARLSLYDRNGPTFRALLALNPRMMAEARA